MSFLEPIIIIYPAVPFSNVLGTVNDTFLYCYSCVYVANCILFCILFSCCMCFVGDTPIGCIMPPVLDSSFVIKPIKLIN